jgi:hypothetical protein|tara:strand:+ start:760 stop:948 length:189 start_codon:yes stop_codon:yes gene_type:complete
MLYFKRCFKCNKNSWDLIVADGKFDSKKKKLYCQNCYYNKARKKDLKNYKSIDLMKLLKGNK